MSLQRIDRRLMACDTLFLSKHSRRQTEFCAIALYIPFVTLQCQFLLSCTVDSRYLELEGTLWDTSRYPYFDISDVQNWGKYQSNNQISQMNM